MVDAGLAAVQQLFSAPTLIAFLIILPIALVAGLMPGGGLPVAAVILGSAAFLDPWVAIPLIVFYNSANDITEPVTSILMGIPGSRSSQATVLDGYPMTKRGLGSYALGASYTSSLVGGVQGALVLLLAIPVAREGLRLFGSPEFFLLAMLGILSVAVVSAGAMVKGLLAACFAVAVAMIGTSPILGTIRATMGVDYLWDGIELAPLVIGLFAIPEAIELVIRNTSLARVDLAQMRSSSRVETLRGMRDALQYKALIVRSSLIGTFVGMLPGVGASGAHWIAYANARQYEKGATETFGRGDVRGVIAAESANNASDGGTLIPTLFFGIAGSASMAFLIATMALSGQMTPGAQMVDDHLDMTMALVITIAFANVVVVPIMLYLAPTLARVASVPPNILAPIVICIVTVSAFLATLSLNDLVVVLGFAALGMFMKAFAWPRAPMLIAVVLAEPIERSLWTSTHTYGWDMLVRPTFLGILAVAGGFVVVSALRRRSGRSVKQLEFALAAGEKSGAQSGERPASSPDEGTSVPGSLKRSTTERIGEAGFLGLIGLFFAYMFVESRSWPDGDRLLPTIAIALGSLLWLAYLVLVVTGRTKTRGQIMDTGFGDIADPRAAGRRLGRIVTFIGVLYAAIWLLGFQVAVPLVLAVYLRRHGRLSWPWVLVVCVVFELLLAVGLGQLLDVRWPEPELSRLLGWQL